MRRAVSITLVPFARREGPSLDVTAATTTTTISTTTTTTITLPCFHFPLRTIVSPAFPTGARHVNSFIPRPGCFLLRRWCVTRRRKKKRKTGDRKREKVSERKGETDKKKRGYGKRRVIGRFRALCRSPRLRNCVCATLFAQQLEVGILPPRKSPPHAAQVRKGEELRCLVIVVDEYPRGEQLAGWLPPIHPPSPPSFTSGPTIVDIRP